MDTRDEQPAPTRQSAEELLSAVYAELRRLAGALSGRPPPGQTTTPTALVHEVYLRLVGNQGTGWEGRRDFFGAAAQAMREILITQARRKARHKRGGKSQRIELAEGLALIEPPADDLLAVDEAIQRLMEERLDLAEIALLRNYGGLSNEETAGALGGSVSTLQREWRFARAWLQRYLDQRGAHE
jgi:RNA polymerase sigma factor (TIGR02999 family)